MLESQQREDQLSEALEFAKVFLRRPKDSSKLNRGDGGGGRGRGSGSDSDSGSGSSSENSISTSSTESKNVLEALLIPVMCHDELLDWQRQKAQQRPVRAVPVHLG